MIYHQNRIEKSSAENLKIQKKNPKVELVEANSLPTCHIAHNLVTI